MLRSYKYENSFIFPKHTHKYFYTHLYIRNSGDKGTVGQTKLGFGAKKKKQNGNGGCLSVCMYPSICVSGYPCICVWGQICEALRIAAVLFCCRCSHCHYICGRRITETAVPSTKVGNNRRGSAENQMWTISKIKHKIQRNSHELLILCRIFINILNSKGAHRLS